MTTAAQDALRAGDPAAALADLQQQVRADGANPKLRIFLFQLLAITGQWQRALTQLELCGELDHGALAMVQTYRAAIESEAPREAVFAGQGEPHVIGAPNAWVALMVQALAADARGDGAGAFALRSQAMDDAPARPVRIGERDFEWVADADSRLGPILEVIVAGRYAWLPMESISKLEIEAPTDLRDLVWLPATIELTHGGNTVALLPARYPGTASWSTSESSGASSDGALLMGRRTEWLDMGHDQYRGLGQKLLATDQHEVGLLDVRQIVFDEDAEGPRTIASEI
jgi:type VI secretion system protein ImpE